MSDANRLQEIKDAIEELLWEAKELFPKGIIGERAKSYWLPHMQMALDNNHSYLGGSMCTMQETIDDMEDEGNLQELDLLKEDALSSCNFRGHSMKAWDDYSEGNASSECSVCGAFVGVHVNPPANGIEVHGDAVALTCPVDTKE